MFGRRLSIRSKLLLLSLALLSIPYVGFEYLRETERLLRDSLENALLAAARTHAAPLHENPALFPLRPAAAGAALFVHPLQHEVQLDGYTDDWKTYLEWSDTYTSRGKLERGVQRGRPNFGFRLILGNFQHYLYALVQVYDDDVIYAPAHRLDGDRIDVVFTDMLGTPRVYSFSTAAPGRTTPVERVLDADGQYIIPGRLPILPPCGNRRRVATIWSCWCHCTSWAGALDYSSPMWTAIRPQCCGR